MAGLEGASRANFPATRWSLVRSAAGGSERAVEELCRAYSGPVYAYFRRLGYDPEAAGDMTQDFFASRVLDPERRAGLLRDEADLTVRFRAFLRVCLRNFAGHARERAGAVKRGGAATIVSFDAAAAERTAALLDGEQPARAFDVAWARCVVDRVFERLQGELDEDCRRVLARTLQRAPDKEIAGELEVSPNRVAKLRKRALDRARRLLEEELRETVSTSADLQEELGELARIYSLPSWLVAG
jgi:RNA polymerase sigma factor (sigma-70 family)